MENNEPRYHPSYTAPNGDVMEYDDTFWGYANDLDVWWDDDRELVVVVGPYEKKIYKKGDTNFDAFEVVDGVLIMEEGPKDIHIDVHDMCLIYAICVEHGLLKENTNEPR